MVQFFQDLSFAQLAWLSVIVYILHYMEEGPYLVKWFKTRNMIGKINYTQQKLNLENILLFSLNFVIVVLLNLYPDNWILQSLVFSAAFGFIGNTVFHALPTLNSRYYSPSVVTACLLNPLLFIAYFLKVHQLGLLTWKLVILAIVAGTVLLPIAIFITHNMIIGNSNPGPKWLLSFPVREKSVYWETSLKGMNR